MKVRVAALRKDIQVVEKELQYINEYMQAVGLLYAAKEDCTFTSDLAKVDKEPPVVISVDTPEEEEEELVITPEKVVKPRRQNIFTRLFDKFGQLIEEGENDYEDDDETK